MLGSLSVDLQVDAFKAEAELAQRKIITLYLTIDAGSLLLLCTRENFESQVSLLILRHDLLLFHGSVEKLKIWCLLNCFWKVLGMNNEMICKVCLPEQDS